MPKCTIKQCKITLIRLKRDELPSRRQERTRLLKGFARRPRKPRRKRGRRLRVFGRRSRRSTLTKLLLSRRFSSKILQKLMVGRKMEKLSPLRSEAG